MVNFSFSVFGPEDGFKLFTVSTGALSPDDSFEISPSEFDFKTGGRLIQVIKLNGSVYISYHQQIFQVNSERPGYTFGEALYFESNNFNSSLIVENLSKLHAAFSHECLTENGRFDGSRFVNSYKSTQADKYNILKENISSNAYTRDNLIENIAFPNAVNGYYKCTSLRDLVDVSRVVTWMVESIGSIHYSRLLIIDNESGLPSEAFKKITNIDAESNGVFNSIYSSYKDYQQECAKLGKIKTDLAKENNDLFAKVNELSLRLTSLNNSNKNTAQVDKVSIMSPNQNLSHLQSSVDLLRSDIGKITGGLHKIQSVDLLILSEDLSVTKAFSWINAVLFFILIFAIGYIIFELNSLHQKSIRAYDSHESAVTDLNKSIKDLKNMYAKPVLPAEEVKVLNNPKPEKAAPKGKAQNVN
jgi:hypothetical protein